MFQNHIYIYIVWSKFLIFYIYIVWSKFLIIGRILLIFILLPLCLRS